MSSLYLSHSPVRLTGQVPGFSIPFLPTGRKGRKIRAEGNLSEIKQGHGKARTESKCYLTLVPCSFL